MAFATDDFSLVAGDINGDSLSGSGTWTHHGSSDLNSGSFQANSGKVYQNGTGVDCGYYTSHLPGTPDYAVELDVSSASVDASLGSSGLGVMGRVATGAATGYIAYVDRTTVYIYKIVAGTYTLLGSASWSPASGTTYRLKLEMVGTAIKAYIDGTLKVSVTDSSITADGRAGLYGYSLYGGSFLNSWMGDNFSAATVVVPAQISGSSSASATGSLSLGTGTSATITPSASNATATASLNLQVPAGLGSLASTATADGTLALATSSAVGVRAAPGWLGLFITDTGGGPVPTISGGSTATATGALSIVTPARAPIAGSSTAIASGTLSLRGGGLRQIATPTSLTSPQFGTSTLESVDFGVTELVPADQHTVTVP